MDGIKIAVANYQEKVDKLEKKATDTVLNMAEEQSLAFYNGYLMAYRHIKERFDEVF